MTNPLETLELRNQEHFLMNHNGSPIKKEFKDRLLSNIKTVPTDDPYIKDRVDTCIKLIKLIPTK